MKRAKIACFVIALCIIVTSTIALVSSRVKGTERTNIILSWNIGLVQTIRIKL